MPAGIPKSGYNKGWIKKGDKLSDERKKNISKALKGKPKSEEHKRHMSEARIRKREGKIIKCFVCGKEFYVHPSRMKRRNTKFCSRKCYGKYQEGKKLSFERKKNMSLGHGGTGIPQRTSKRYYHLRDKKYMDWRVKVFVRDNFTCQLCRKVGVYLMPHHINGWAKYPKLRYELSNGITLCKECHKLVHKKH